LLVILCACGRIGFGTVGDGGSGGDGVTTSDAHADAASGAGFTLLGPFVNSQQMATSIVVGIPTLPAGDTIVLVVNQSGGTVAVSTAGGGAQLAGRSTDTACPGAIEIWYAMLTAQSANAIGVQMAAPANVVLTVVAIEGATQYSASAQLNSQAKTIAPVSAARLPPNVPAAYIASVQSCGNVQGITGPPFTAFAPQGSTDVAYYLSPGTSGAQAAWVSSNATYTSNVIELH
jgi:hypothetical protein